MENKVVAQPNSTTAVDADALSKEEKEALLTKKMNLIRERNKAISERHKLIEADRRQAEEAGQAVKPSVDSQTLPAEGAPKTRGRGRGYLYHEDNITPGREKPKSFGNTRDTTLYEPIVDATGLANYKGRGHEPQHNRGDAPSNMPQTKRNSTPRNENTAFPSRCEYEPIVDITDLDKRFGPLLSAKEGRSMSHNHHPGDVLHNSSRTYKGRPKDDESGDVRRAPGRAYRGRLNSDESAGAPQTTARSYKGKQKDDETGDSPLASGRSYKGKLKDDESGETPHGSGRTYKGRGGMDDESGETPHGSGRTYKGRGGMDDEPGDASQASGRAYKGRLKDDEGPPPDPSFNPLADRSRSDQKEGFSDSKRHPRNYGGSVDLSRVKQSMRHLKERERERPSGDKPLTMVMTGRERKKHEEWKAEREKYDQERIQRQMNNTGSWRRAWDVDKIAQENDEQNSSSLSPEMESMKRPGGLQQYDHSNSEHRIGGIQDHRDQQQRSLSGFQNVQESRTPRGRGRGRARGRGYFREFDGKPTPESSLAGSRSDDRTVQCQKDLLLVKIDNTTGDKTTEVKYEEEFPDLISAAPYQPQTSITRHRPTGQTSQNGSSDQLHSGRQSAERIKTPHGKAWPQATHKSTPEVEQVEAPHTIPNHTEANHVPGDSQMNSESYGDSDEWEDCSDTSDVLEEDDSCHPDVAELTESKESSAANNLHLECTLNPAASEFVPESPDFMKTPPGHVKVLNWATDGCPTSPSSQDSSITSPLSTSQGPLVSPQACPTAQTSASSPYFPTGGTPA